ncbi:MAG: sulfate adenylyltransferase subunit CysD [Candidatus Sericytochromatia bacterium]
MSLLDELENRSIYMLREAYAHFRQLCMLWSIGKDSTVMLWLARKAFLGEIPFPLVHVDTHYKIPEMIRYRDAMTRQWGLQMIVGSNETALAAKQSFPDGSVSRLECCRLLKTEALRQTLDGTGPRQRFNHASDRYELDTSKEAYTGVIAGIRGDEEGSRSKERYFSPRQRDNRWRVDDQPPEFWNQFQVDFAPGTHVRIHPLLDWSELHIWQYIARENIPTVSLYYNQGDGQRYRSLGCAPCTQPIASAARTPAEIVAELQSGALRQIAERSGRAQDQDDGGTLENLRLEGYM